MSVQVISPSVLNKNKIPTGSCSIRVAKNIVAFSVALSESARLSAGSCINFVLRDGVLFMYKSALEDAFILKRNKSKECHIFNRQLAAIIARTYGISDLIENGKASSWSFKVAYRSEPMLQGQLIEGVSDYWEILPPKKYQSP